MLVGGTACEPHAKNEHGQCCHLATISIAFVALVSILQSLYCNKLDPELRMSSSSKVYVVQPCPRPFSVT